MLEAMDKLSHLADDTKVFCGHEYTLANFRFAESVEPTNEALLQKIKWALAQREKVSQRRHSQQDFSSPLVGLFIFNRYAE